MGLFMDNISRKYANFKSGNNFSMKNVMPEKLFGGGMAGYGALAGLKAGLGAENRGHINEEEAQNIVGGNHLARNTFQSPLDKIASRQSQSPFTIAQNNLIQRAKKQFNSGLQSNQNSRQEPKQGLAADNPFINHANTFNELSKHVKPLPYENEMSEGAKKFQENYKYNDIQNYLKHQGLAAISNPRGTIAENSAVGLKNFAESSEHGKNRQLNAEEKAMNVYSKINDSRQKTQELLADYGLKREDLEAKKELNKAQIGHYGASNAHMAAQNEHYAVDNEIKRLTALGMPQTQAEALALKKTQIRAAKIKERKEERGLLGAANDTIFGMDLGDDTNTIQKNGKNTSVKMKSPEGGIGTVPNGRIQEFLNQGYTYA
jgi:hypothetical protein